LAVTCACRITLLQGRRCQQDSPRWCSYGLGFTPRVTFGLTPASVVRYPALRWAHRGWALYGNGKRNAPKTNLEKREITGLDWASLIRLRASERESRGHARYCFSEPWQENASPIDGTPIRRLTQLGFQVSSRPTSLPPSRPSSHPSPRPSTIVPQLS